MSAEQNSNRWEVSLCELACHMKLVSIGLHRCSGSSTSAIHYIPRYYEDSTYSPQKAATGLLMFFAILRELLGWANSVCALC